jgi:mono/diheme cytochrome c family protein
MRTKVMLGIGAVVAVTLAVALVASGGSFDTASVAVPAHGDPTAGRGTFEGTCATCHGIGGTGTNLGPPLVHDYYRPGHHADGAFTLAIRNGVQPHHWNFGPMPAQPHLSNQDIADVTAYVRTIQEAAGIR